MSRGMQFLTLKGVLHNDLAARNVLVSKNDRDNENQYLLKITDFGLSTLLGGGDAANFYYKSSESTVPVRSDFSPLSFSYHEFF